MLNVGFVRGFVCKNWFSSIWWFEIISYSTSKYNCFANHVKHVEFWSIQEKKFIDKKKIIPGLGSRFLEACYRKQSIYFFGLIQSYYKLIEHMMILWLDISHDI